jgi:hypothetical protein
MSTGRAVPEVIDIIHTADSLVAGVVLGRHHTQLYWQGKTAPTPWP